MMGHRSVVAGKPGLALALMFGSLTALALLTVLVLAALSARAETGAPVLGGDGIWRSSGDWTVQAGDRLTYENVTIEASGSLAVQSGGNLTLGNVSLRFTAAGLPSRVLLVEAGGFLELLNSTLFSDAPGLILRVQGTFASEFSELHFAQTASDPYSVRVELGRLTLANTLVLSDASAAVSASSATFHMVDTDFLTSSASHSAISLSGNGSYVFDTSNFGTLSATSVSLVSIYSTVRFQLQSPSGNGTAGHLNGTGIDGAQFFTDADAQGKTNALRFLLVELAPADGVQLESARVSPSAVTVTAVAKGVGGNTTSFVLNAPRVNVTLVLDKPYDVAVVFFVVPGAQLAGQPHLAYYVPLGANVTVLVRIKNAGEAQSPAATINLTQWSADPVSWANREARYLPPLPLPSLAPGESANFSFIVFTDAWGGQQEKRTDCYHSLSYRTNLDARVTGAEAGDFGPWDDLSTLSLHAFRVEGNETAPCGTGGQALIPYYIAGTLGVIVAVWLVTRYFSESAEARRAARRLEQVRERELSGGRPPQKP